MENTQFKTIRIKEQDYNKLKAISEKTMIPIVKLIGVAISELKSKYRSEDK